jgi:hypothetical protein
MKRIPTAAILLTLFSHGVLSVGAQTTPATPRPEAFLADINGDGIPDRIVVQAGNLAVYVATSLGVYSTSPVILATSVQGAAVGTFRGVSINDIAILSTSGQVYMLVNNGTGVFTPSAAFDTAGATITSTCQLASGNFFNRTSLDLAVVCPSQPPTVVLGLNDGTGNFQFTAINQQTLAPKMQNFLQNIYGILQGALHP